METQPVIHQVQAFNLAHPVGAPVRYTYRPNDRSTKKHSRTLGRAHILDGTAVVQLKGERAPTPLHRVEVLA